MADFTLKKADPVGPREQRSDDFVDQGLQGLEKMSLRDIKAPQIGNNENGWQTFDYSHLLPDGYGTKGYSLRVRSSKCMVPDGSRPQPSAIYSVIERRGPGTLDSIGTVEGVVHRTPGVLQINEASIENEADRGHGLGSAAYEAVMAHAINHHNCTSVHGGTHSTDADRVHRKLAQKHGFEYKRTKELNPDRDQLRRQALGGGADDGRFGPYTYILKSEATLEKVEPDHNRARGASVWVERWDGHVLWGRRRTGGTWTLPGGHLEAGEEPAEGACRELWEEAGLQPDVLYQLGQANGGPDGQFPVFIFKAVAHGEPTSANDPDNEVAEWTWRDCSQGVPEDILSNLAHPKNCVLQYLFGEEQPMAKAEKPPQQQAAAEADHSRAHQKTGFWGRQAAGCVIVARDTGRVLLPHRSENVLEPNTWGTWGGAIDPGEDPAAAVHREVTEEAGYPGQVDLHPAWTFQHPSGFCYHNFIAAVDHEFEPKLNWETQAHQWVQPGQWPRPLHPGLKALINRPEFQQTLQQALKPR